MRARCTPSVARRRRSSSSSWRPSTSSCAWTRRARATLLPRPCRLASRPSARAPAALAHRRPVAPRRPRRVEPAQLGAVALDVPSWQRRADE
eukprot:2788653-Alexandrium_andersonii.AAC.1